MVDLRIENDGLKKELEADEFIISQLLKLICKTFVAEEYQEQMRAFFDLTTLRERLKEKLYTSREYPNREGIWRRATFIVRERDTEFNLCPF